MKVKILLPLFILFLVLLFFYPIFQGKVPFPGDLLVGQYNPYNALSIDGFTSGSVPHKAQGIDVVRELYPWKHFVISEIKSGRLPFWNPHQFSGQNLLANFQSGAFYPLNLLFLLIPSFVSAWTVYILLTPLLSITFLYLFLRTLNVSKQASLFGGVVFAFSSYMAVWMEYGNIGHTLLYLPLVLLAVEKLLREYKVRYALLFLGSLLCSFFAGYIQGYFYITAIVVAYYLIRREKIRKINLKRD